MKNIFVMLLTIALIVTSGCSKKKTDNIKSDRLNYLSPLIKDSIIQDSIRDAHDSILQIEKDKAIGNINFGISQVEYKKQAKKLLIFLGGTDKNPRIGNFSFDLSGETFSCNDIFTDGYSNRDNNEAYFFNNMLFNLTIKGGLYRVYDNESGEYYDYNRWVNSSVYSLKEFYEKKYGKPSEDFNAIKEWRDKQTGRVYPAAKWNIGYKSVYIFVDVSKDVNETGFVQVKLSLTDNRLLSQMNKVNLEKQDRLKNKEHIRRKISDSLQNLEKIKYEKKLEAL